MIFNPQIYVYLVFVVAEATLYFFMAFNYQSRMLDYSWDNHVAIEKYIVTALWVAGSFYTLLSLSNIYTVVTVTSAPYLLHMAITLFNAAKRVSTLGVVLVLSSGRRLSTPLVIAALFYFCLYVSVSEYLRKTSHTLHTHPGLFTKLWPTFVDLLLLGYAWMELKQTIHHIEESQQVRKLVRYCWLSRLLTCVFLALCLKQMSSLASWWGGAFLVELDQMAFFALLAGIGALWWPSPANRDYENVVEMLPTSTELEREAPLFANCVLHELELREETTAREDDSDSML